MNFTNLGLTGITSLLLVMLLMPIVIRLAHYIRAVDIPGERSVHKEATPRTGGLAIFITFLISILFFIPTEPVRNAFIYGLIIIVITGLVDDIWGIGSKLKFIGEIVAALVFILLSDTSINSFGDLLGFGVINPGVLSIPVTVFCVVGVINALNMSDGLDGLAGGLSIIACLFLGYFALVTGYWLSMVLVASLLGSLLGFLFYNAHPARIFMGDTGSLLLGYSLTAIAILFQHTSDEAPVEAISMALILALPTLDTILVMTVRMLKGKSPVSADRTHLHHRLLALGFSHTDVVSIMYSLMFIYGILAVVMRDLPEYTQFGVGILLAILIFGSVYYLQSISFSVSNKKVFREFRNLEQVSFRGMVALLDAAIPVTSWLIPLLLIVPLLGLETEITGVPFAMLIIALAFFLLLPWSRSMGTMHHLSNGLIYIMTFVLLCILNIYGNTWVEQFIRVLMLVVACWALFMILFKEHGTLPLTSNLELLMIIISWFIPFVLLEVIDVGHEVQRDIIRSCLEAVPFLFAIKILIHHRPNYSSRITGCLSAGFLLAAVQQIIQ